MTELELVSGLAGAIRAAVAPRLGWGGEVTGTTESGDASFALDQVAEHATAEYMAASGLKVAVFTEDRGLVGPPGSEWILVVDPIDGSRPAKCGLECCCVSVALARNVPGAALADVTHAAVYELKSDRLFVAERGGGVRIVESGREVPPALSGRREPFGAALSVELTGRPIGPLVTVLEELIDGSSLRGGVFCFASTTFALTRIVLGKFDAHVDPADRIRRDRPRLNDLFLRAGCGRPMALFVYDLAAVVLIAQEAGVSLSDAYGGSLDAVPLTDVSPAWHRSLVAAATPELHAALLASIERGLARIES